MTCVTPCSTPLRRHDIAKQFAMVALCAPALATMFTLAHASVRPELATDRQTLYQWTQCERDGGIALERLAANGIDLRTQKSRSDRARAIQACRQGFPNLRWLNLGNRPIGHAGRHRDDAL